MTRLTIVPAALALLLLSTPAPARACPGEGDLIVLAAMGVLLPSEVGAEVDVRGDHTVAPVIAWAYQLPLPVGAHPEDERHRVAFTLDWKPGSSGPDVAARVGYRYVRGPIAVGLGVSGDPDGLRLSPEIVVQPWGGQFKPHLLVRAEGNTSDLRGLVTLGWSVF
jgi:hypothetical protein